MITRIPKLLAGAALAAMLAIPATPASAELLGTRVVAYGSETDVIRVPGTTRYSAIKICVYDHAVRFRDLDVVYANGGRDDLPLRRVISAGDCTRWIDLRAGRRDIRRIVLNYETWGNSGPRAKITAQGR